MLIRKPILDAIREGTVDRAYRRWSRPAAKAGGTLKTAVGVLSILKVEEVEEASLTEAAARRAGHASRAGLLKELGARAGTLYRIHLKYLGTDPRLELRARTGLTRDELATLRAKFDRLDAGKRGAWTRRALEAIAKHPREPAGELAAMLNLPKEWLKISIRKLKNLGLTISHEPGYSLSPRGKEALLALKKP